MAKGMPGKLLPPGHIRVCCWTLGQHISFPSPSSAPHPARGLLRFCAVHHSEEGGGPTKMSKTLPFPEITRDQHTPGYTQEMVIRPINYTSRCGTQLEFRILASGGISIKYNTPFSPALMEDDCRFSAWTPLNVGNLPLSKTSPFMWGQVQVSCQQNSLKIMSPICMLPPELSG